MTGALEQSIYNTVRYFALFDMPVTATQIWRALVLGHEDSRVRWHGEHLPGLRAVRETLADSVWLRTVIETKWGYFFIAGQEKSVRRRLARHVIAQHKWRLARRLAGWLAAVPFVNMIAGSGSLALSNTRPESDFDLFVIVRTGRMWTARLLLLLVAQLLGRRRKHWDRLAPDRLCLNHYVTDRALVMPAAVRNLYTAVAYTHLTPLFNENVLARFQVANAPWIKSYLMYPDAPALPAKQGISLPSSPLWFKNLLEGVLNEPVGEALERWAGRVQRRMIAEHTLPGRSGRIAVSDDELAFHPDSRVPHILRQFAQDTGQKALL